MKIKEIITYLDSVCPGAYQENYDNCGLITGDKEQTVTGILLCVDSTEDVLKEAVKLKCNLIIAHHPILFFPIKKLTGKTYFERVIINSIKHDICIYAMHTNLDNIMTGVNNKIAQKIGLENLSILSPKNGLLRKLITFCPVAQADKVRSAIFSAGAGKIGNYDECSFNTTGTGTFRAGKDTKPYIGTKEKRHYEPEEKIETVYSVYQENDILQALFNSHPYEEVAYDIYTLNTIHSGVGSGMIGKLKKPLTGKEFLAMLKKNMKLSCIRFTSFTGKKIEKIAICGGAGSFLLTHAINAGADAFVTADYKYHQFFDAEGRIMIADIGHYESEQFTPEIIYDLLNQKFPTFAPLISKINTNPINYF